MRWKSISEISRGFAKKINSCLVVGGPSRPIRRQPRLLPRLLVEALEERQLLSTLPAAVVSNQATIAQGYAPSIAQDPVNPLKMVMVSSGPVLTADYSNDGGANWTTFINIPNPQFPGSLPQYFNPLINLPDPNLNPVPPNRPNPLIPFDQVTSAQVVMDRDENIYVIEIES